MWTGRRNSRLIERIDASTKNVRKFGYLFGAIGLVASAYLLYRGKFTWPYFGGAGLLFLAGALFAVPLLRPVYRAWMAFAHVLGWINARVLLGLFFYLVLTPVGLILRISGKDLLDEKIDRGAPSYWIRRERRADEKGRLERLF